ncbi:hypothetical protein JCM8202_002846 [Rhodotorula sphaerocarpa]
MAAPQSSQTAPVHIAPPARPRLKRSHPSESAAGSSSLDVAQPIAVPVAASPTAPPTGAIAWANGALGAQHTRAGALEPISEADSLLEHGGAGGALGLDFAGRTTPAPPGNSTSAGASAGADEPPRAIKRIRVAPDHEAFGRLSLDRTSVEPPAAPSAAASAYSQGRSPTSPHSSLPPHLLRQPSQPLPTPPLGAHSAFPSAFPTPNGPRSSFTGRRPDTPPALAVPPPTHAFSSPTFASAAVPSAPPTSPVQASGAAPRSAKSQYPGLVPSLSPPSNPNGVLPTVPWSQSAFFASPPTHSISPPTSSAPIAPSPRADEIEMGAADAASWDLDPHRIYVASLDDDDQVEEREDAGNQADDERFRNGERGSEGAGRSRATTADDEEQYQIRLNALAARRAATASALPAALIAQLEREATKAREGSLVLYRPPPWSAAATAKGQPGAVREKALEKHEESWREFERERQRVEQEDADVDGAGMSDAGETAFDDDTLVGGDDPAMDVEMEL